MNSATKKLKTSEGLQELGNKLYSYECYTYSFILTQPPYRDQQSAKFRCYLYKFIDAPDFGVIFFFEFSPLPYETLAMCRDSHLMLSDIEMNACKEFQAILWKDMFIMHGEVCEQEVQTSYLIVPIKNGNIDFEVIEKALKPVRESMYSTGKMERGMIVQGLYKNNAIWYVIDIFNSDTIGLREFMVKLMGRNHPKLEEMSRYYEERSYGILDVIYDTNLNINSLYGFRALFENYIKELEEPYTLFFVKPIRSARQRKKSSSKEDCYSQGTPIIHPSLLREFYLTQYQIQQIHIITKLLYDLHEFSYLVEFSRQYDYHGDFYILRQACTAPSLSKHNYEALENLGDTVLKAITSLHYFVANNQHKENRLTHERTAIIKNDNLLNISKLRCLYRFLKTAKHQYTTIRPAYFNIKSDAFRDKISHKFSEKMIADHVEALIGAFYEYDGIKSAAHFLDKLGVFTDEKWNVTLNSLNSEKVGILTPEMLPLSDKELLTDELFSIPPISDTSNSTDKLSDLQYSFRYQFNDLHLLQEALTHRSADPKNNYERLEYLGDAILDLIIVGNIFPLCSDFTAEELTVMKHILVNNNVFAKCAVSLELYRYLRCDMSIRDDIDEYLCNIDWRENILDFGVYKEDPPKHLNDIFEAVVGAIFLDSKSLIETSKIVISILYKSILYLVSSRDKLQQNIMSKLSNLEVKLKKKLTYEKTQEGKQFTIRIYDENSKLISEATSSSEKLARSSAALIAYNFLDKDIIRI